MIRTHPIDDAPFSMLFLAICFAACSGASPISETVKPEHQAIKMRHQILFAQGDEEQVFEGYMILKDNSFLVKAFAGPGIDLFTVVHQGRFHAEKLHIPGLGDKIDLARVGADIARVYLGGCDSPKRHHQIVCDFFGEKMIEKLGSDGQLVERVFPEAHGIGLTIRYTEYSNWSGRSMPAKIILTWGDKSNRMVIRLIALEASDGIDATVFKLH